MSKYKLANGEIVDLSNYSSDQRIIFLSRQKEGYSLVTEDFQNGAAGTSASATPKNGQALNGDSSLDLGSSDLIDPFKKYYVTKEDLIGDESNVKALLDKKLSRLGIEAAEGTSFSSTNALNFNSTKDVDVQGGNFIIDGIGDFFEGLLPSLSSVNVGENADDLEDSVIKINNYIKDRGDLSFLPKVKAESKKAYNDYIEKVKAPVLDDSAVMDKYKESKIAEYEKLKQSQTTATVDEFGSGAEIFTKLKEKNFNSVEEFDKYKAWEKEGYVADLSKEELKDFDNNRINQHERDASLRWANDSDSKERMSVFALATDDEEKITNFQTDVDDFYKSSETFENVINNYKNDPTIENLTIAQAEQVSYLEKQGELQATQARMKASGLEERSQYVPLALEDLNKDYNFMRRLSSAANKNVVTPTAYFLAQMAVLLPGAGNIGMTNFILKDAIIEDATGLLSAAKNQEAEQDNFMRAIEVDEIRSVSDAGLWVNGAAVNLLPSLALALTGPAAMPLFFATGSGSKGLDIALGQQKASTRMIENKNILLESEASGIPLSLEQEASINSMMEEDSKILGVDVWQNLSTQAIYGLAEVVLEKLGTINMIKNIKAGLKTLPPLTIKQGAAFVGRQLGKGALQEGGTEFATTFVQNMADINILGEDKNYFEGGLESFAQGALMGGGMNMGNIAKGTRRGLITVLANKKQSSDLKAILKSLQETTGIKDLAGWEDIAGLIENNSLVLDPAAQVVVDDLIKKMQAEENGVTSRLGVDLTIDEAYAADEAARKMRLIVAQLENAANSNMPAGQLAAVQKQLKEDYDALSLVRENILTNQANIDTNKTKSNDADVSFQSSQGWLLYEQVMLNESIAQVMGDYSKLDNIAKQKGYDEASRLLESQGQENITLEDIKNQAAITYVNKSYKEKILKGKDSAIKFAKDNGLEVEIKTFEGPTANAETIQAFIDAGVTGSELARLTKEVNDGAWEGGAIGDSGLIVINLNNSVANKRVGVFAHEILHVWAKKNYGKNPQALALAGDSLLAYLEKNQPDLFAKVKFRVDQSYTEDDGSKKPDYYEEVMNAMSDVLADGQTVSESTINKIRNFANNFLPLNYQFKSNQKRQVYDFVKAYNKSAHFGGKYVAEPIVNAVVEQEDEASKTKVTSSASKSAKGTVLETINALIPDTVKTKADFQNRKVFNKVYQATLPNGVISNYIKSKSESKEVAEKTMESIQDRLINYDPEAVRKKANGQPITFGEFIFANTNFGKLDAKKSLAIEQREAKEKTSIDSPEAKQVADNSSSSTETIQRSKYKNLLESKLLSSDVLRSISDKVLKTVRTLKSRMDAKVSLNKTITPLVAEIKKDMGKQADIDLKKAMGSKKGGELESFLLKNKKAILENMTTTWLMGAMPGAIQKQVNGKFISDWQGKKIDRETVNTNNAGKTSGAEIVRRLPNAAQNISDEVFLGYILDAKGNPIRGRKESLAKALAEEVSFDIFNQQLKNSESDISKAFENNQAAKGVVLLDSYIEELSRDIDRGTVKSSVTKTHKIIEGKSKDLLDTIANMDVNLTKTSLKAALNKVYENELSAEEIDAYAKNALKGIQKYIKKDDAKEIGFDKFVFEEMQLQESDSNLMKAFGLTSKIFGSFKQLFEIGNNISKQRELSLSYNINLVAKEGKEGLIKLLKYSRGHQTSSGKIGGGRMQIFKGNGDYINNNLNVIPGVEVVWNTETNRIKSVSYKGEVIADWQKLIRTPPQNASGGKAKFEADYNSRLNEAREAWTFLTDFLQHIKNEGNTVDWIMTMMSLKSNMASVLKAAAPVKYYFEGVQSGKLRYEHMIPTEYMVLKLTEYYFKGKKFDLDSLRDKYNVAIIPVSMDDKFNIQRQKQMNPNWDPMRDPETDRYYDSGTFGYSDIYAIEVLGGKNKGEIIGKDWVKINNNVKPNVSAELETRRAKQKAETIKVKSSTTKKAGVLNKGFNDMLERSKGVASDANFSRIVAKRRGASKGKFKVWMPSSLNDFKGLTSYTFAGKGRQGDADQKFFKENLIDPYFKGIAAIETSRQTMKDDFVALNKMFKPVVKSLGTLIESGDYTNDQAIRVYLWSKAGFEIPGLSKRDQKKLLKHINENPDLKAYADGVLLISKQPNWIKPGAFWDAQTILSDLGNMTEKVGRKNYIEEFIENADVIFSEANLNKIEALYGTRHREALEDILYRMKNGTNRPAGASKNQNIFNNWVNNSIGAIMFFNRRSALLQTLSTVNFLNWSDNNPAKAALAFANQPQYWKDFATIFNSAKLKQRRSGLKSDINEAEIASAVKGSKNKATAALSWLLKKGFLPTQMADSFAIAAGGATFYRNRINTLMKKGMSKAEAEAKAFSDFSEISEETQQSGDPALISSDQASVVGRLLLAFQNTPIQLNRSIKKSAQDIYNRRKMPGQTQIQSDFSNISKIVYYGAIQNVIFTALSNALFALLPGFDDEEPTEEELQKLEDTKIARMANGIIDTTLKGGFGLPGAVLATIKNVIMEYNKQDKKGFTADHTYTILQAANLAPPIGSKLGKIYSGIQGSKFNRRVIEKRGFDVKAFDKFNLSPKYSVWGKYIEGTTNLPLGRAVDEINAIVEAFDTRNTIMQRIALGLGWRNWDVGVENEENDLIDTLMKIDESTQKKIDKRNKKKK